MRWGIGGTLALLVVILLLTRLQGRHPGLDPRDQLAFEAHRAEQRRHVPPAAGVLACAALHADASTVETLYRQWVDYRPDLTTPQERDDATADLERAVRGCGGDPVAEEDRAHRAGLDLGRAASGAMLATGR